MFQTFSTCLSCRANTHLLIVVRVKNKAEDPIQYKNIYCFFMRLLATMDAFNSSWMQFHNSITRFYSNYFLLPRMFFQSFFHRNIVDVVAFLFALSVCM